MRLLMRFLLPSSTVWKFHELEQFDLLVFDDWGFQTHWVALRYEGEIGMFLISVSLHEWGPA